MRAAQEMGKGFVLALILLFLVWISRRLLGVRRSANRPVPAPQSSNALQVGRAIKSTWMLLTKNIEFWSILSLVLHFVSWKFFSQMELDLNNYTNFRVGTSQKDATQPPEWPHYLRVFLTFSGHFILLQVAASKLIYKQLRNDGQQQNLGKIFLQFKTIDFMSDLLRGIQIISIQLILYFLSAIFVVLSWKVITYIRESTFGYVHKFSNSNYGLSMIITITIGLILFFIVGSILLWSLVTIARCLLAVPVTVIEHTNVRESFKRSWRMTASCEFRFFFVTLALPILISIPVGLLVRYVFFYDMTIDELNLFAGLISTISVVVISVCYFILHTDDTKLTQWPWSRNDQLFRKPSSAPD